MPTIRTLPILLAGLLTLGLFAPASAQKQPLDHDAYDIWRTIDDEAISDDGRWVLYRLEVRVGDGELVVRQPSGDEYRVPRAVDPEFIPDSRYALFTIEPAYDSVRALRLADTPSSEMPEDTLGIMELATGTVTKVPGVRSWALPEESGGIVAYMIDTPEDTVDEAGGEAMEEEEAGEEAGEAAADAEEEDEARDKPDTHTLVIRTLASGTEVRFDQVVDYVVSQDGARVAYTASSEDGMSDGVFLVMTGSGATAALMTGEGLYEGLTVSEDGERIAFMSDRDSFRAEQPEYVLYAARGTSEAVAVASSETDGVPAGWWVSEHGSLSFSESGDRLFFGTAPQPEPEPEDEEKLLPEERVELDIWHWQDDLLQPQQLLQADSERRRTYQAVVHLNRRNRVVQLATEALPNVEVGREGDADVALAETNVDYRHLIGIESPGYSDLWVIDVTDGERRQLLQEERIVWSHLSPDAGYAAWYDYDQRAWYAVETDGGQPVNISAGIEFPVWDETDDHPMAPFPHGSAGWTEGDAHVLIYDRFDIWAVDPDGRDAPRRITEGYGRDNEIRFRYLGLDDDERAIDPDAPILLSAFGIYSKDSGVFRDRVEGTSRPTEVLYGPKRYGSLEKAEDADVVLYTREDVQEFPDLWVAGTDLQGGQKVSNANPQQSEYNWATVELVEWRSTNGEPLQGLLYKPEDFDPSREYPMMVYFYEKNSDNLHAHSPPLPHRSIIRPTFYASRGYIVFIPDIVYKDGFPGESAMESVMPGTLMLAEEPWVDADNVGVQGHSWGGYQIAYMVTQTDFFKAAEAGAPVSNMTSAYGGIRWGSGLSRMFQYERTQSRIGESLWDNRLRYIENSPLFFLDKVQTPLLIMHNDHDGAVPWYQGIELFVALRRLDKPAWLINYNDEPHWPTTDANIRDWNIRMQQFFDHYLMGAPAPVWLAEGIPATEKGETLGLEPADGGDDGS